MENELREGFIRQRRNLIISSIVLLFSQASGMSIKKLSVFGNDIELAHPHSITALIWVATIYWLIRYYQYLRDLPSTGTKDIYYRKFAAYIPNVALNRLKAKRPDLLAIPKDQPNAKVYLKLVEYVCFEKSEKFHIGTVASKIIINDVNYASEQDVGPIDVIIENKYLLKPKLFTLLHILLHTTKFTEYVLPILIFLMSVIYFILTFKY